jgi:biotin carboxylase
VPGLSVAHRALCRDKVAMKEFLRERGIPCAHSPR